ncbi:unnamed protein product [Closterium sp. NIES-64]|nr:unnamed protein product [Closterium sp. NIES-64]
MAIPLHVSRAPILCRYSVSEHSPTLQSLSPRPPLRLTAALTTAPATLRTAPPPATSPAAPPRAVRRPTACRSAAEAAGLASFSWENAPVPGGGARGGEGEWGRGNAEAAAGDVEADVVIVGAGVVGLCIADALLMSSPDTRVAVIDSAWPCAGATGAGQGYIWMAHRSPGGVTWQLAEHSKRRWEEMAGGLEADHRRLTGCTQGLGRINTGKG